jgi:GPH family glycoside/pentoside/hexuronide:cation symporter
VAAPPPLALSTVVLYSLPGAGVSFVYALFLVMYLKFATDTLLISPFAMGGIFLVAKLWNALADPLVGTWSDRTRSRLGRRKAWLLGSALPIGLFTWMAWSPLAGLSDAAEIAWVGAAVLGFYAAFTAFEVPHAALGAELTHDPRSRNRVFGTKYFVRSLGLVAALVFGSRVIRESAAQGRDAVDALALASALGTAALIVLAVASLPRERADYQGRGGVSLMKALADVWANRDARLLLMVFFIESVGLGGLTVLVPYVTEYVLERPQLNEAMLGLYMGSTFLAIPIWVALARRFEKRKLWLFAMVQGGAGFGLLFWLDAGEWLLMATSSVVAGSAGACGNSIGQSLKADLIDLDELRTGERKEGAYFAAWSFVSKLGNALLASSAAFALGFAGFTPNTPQSEGVKLALVFLMGGAPLIGYAVGSLLFARFRFSAVDHARVRAELDARAAAQAAASDLPPEAQPAPALAAGRARGGSTRA